MAHPSNHRVDSTRLVRLVLIFVALFLMVYSLKSSFSGHYYKPRRKSTASASCPRCSCDCASESDSISLSPDIFNMSSSGCISKDPEMNEEMKKDIVALLSEEISLQKNVTHDSLEHTQELIMDTKRTSSHYQKEAQKCYASVDTCEDARERAEAALTEERKFTALWEQRACDFGWKDEKRV
ncbi:hypothetical protein ACH5RR_001367 [Cinchona calisaya]|uniref:Uncharacterized protein n=1 Tax=Cinchona calisaya TaxID=153742 RepID=A0ABD3B3M5_9GENT